MTVPTKDTDQQNPSREEIYDEMTAHITGDLPRNSWEDVEPESPERATDPNAKWKWTITQHFHTDVPPGERARLVGEHNAAIDAAVAEFETAIRRQQIAYTSAQQRIKELEYENAKSNQTLNQIRDWLKNGYTIKATDTSRVLEVLPDRTVYGGLTIEAHKIKAEDTPAC